MLSSPVVRPLAGRRTDVRQHAHMSTSYSATRSTRTCVAPWPPYSRTRVPDAGETVTATHVTAHINATAHLTAPACAPWTKPPRSFPPTRAQAGSPYVALDATYLSRLRGHALVRFGHPNAVTVLTDALAHHEPTFVRAEAGLRAELTLTYLDAKSAARQHVATTKPLAMTPEVGSVRHRRRLPGRCLPKLPIFRRRTGLIGYSVGARS